ncbi:MAG TPA: UvrD-helicase domain-containing protein [Acidimicrobiales bacterium]|jgi:exodeoxyribonuclease V beta subunit|nr:UvrD-helicase domain-containing protein [Acidimicrobiales bacterium]
MSGQGDPDFSIAEELPGANLAIEASAGTGKTYALADIAAQHIAEGRVLASELLIVTFTRAATSELRGRVRERLTHVVDCLRRDTPPEADALLEHLWSSDRATQLVRVERAVSEFDAATITTIHGFAALVLGSLGTTAGTDPDAVLTADDADLVSSACADVLAAAAASGVSADDLPSFAKLRDATSVVCSVSDMAVMPEPSDVAASTKDRVLSELIMRARDEVRARRRQAGTLSYDDLLTEVRRALHGAGADAVAQVLRDRYTLALIDEFQDTDAVQWDIFSTLFGAADGESSLVLVGDPKQAIYSFRGANVHTYLQAVTTSPDLHRRTLRTNWRSDGAVLNSLHTLLDGVTFGDADIAYTPSRVVDALKPLCLTRDNGEPLPALSLRLALGPDLRRSVSGRKSIYTDEADRAINQDLVAQIRALLDGAWLPPDEDGGRPRRIMPSNIAVLVRTAPEARQAQAALIDQGIPAVLARAQSVLLSEAAEQWRWLLWAVERPSDPKRARALALSWFGGWSAQEVGEADDAAFAQLQQQIMGWGETLMRHGVTAFVRQVWTESDVPVRMLVRRDGDRAMTDLQHVGELLQSADPSLRSSVAGLLAALQSEPVGDIDTEEHGDASARRIESEANAVQIMTVWVAKGLEFDVVCLPTLWRTPRMTSAIYQDPVTGLRTLDVSSGKGTKDVAARLAKAEALGEQLRLLYVALTRAKHQTILWWSRVGYNDSTALAHVLFARNEGMIDPDRFNELNVAFPADEDVVDTLEPLLARSKGSMVATLHGHVPAAPGPWSPPATPDSAPPLDVARLPRVPDRGRGRWSFTSLTHGTDGGLGNPYDLSLADSGADDEDTLGEDATAASATVSTTTSPMDLLPAGADFGTLVHAVLERVDFTADQLPATLGGHIDRQLRRTALDLSTRANDGDVSGRDLLVQALTNAIASPLLPSLRLQDLGPASRINEMSFELRLGDAGERATLRRLGRLLVTHLSPDDPFAAWAGSLASRAADITLAGHLTGSIDLIFRTDDSARFFVADYKTNRLTPRGVSARSDDYGRARMIEAMVEHDYPLQALLYMVALHRYLRWRLPVYDPAQHLGGALYLFVRGMTGPEADAAGAGQPGVLHWEPAPALIARVSDLLDGHVPDQVAL